MSLLTSVIILHSFQVPQCYPDYVPTHPALPDHSHHHKQGCPQASAGPEGFGEGHSAGITINFFILQQSVHGYRVFAYRPYTLEDE